MAQENDRAAQIQKILKFQPKGMTISELSKKTGANRDSIARQLDILEVSGKVELRNIGSAKVYSLARRVPLSAFLCFTRNLILVLDKHQRIVQVNDQCARVLRRTPDDLIGRTLEEAALPVVSTPEALAVIHGLDREQVITDLRYRKDGRDLFFQMQVIPTTFDSGEKGCTLVLEDITERKQYVRNMEFLARTASELVDLPPDADIYQYVAEKIVELLPKARVYVQSYDEVSRQFAIRAVGGAGFHEGLIQLLGRDPQTMVIPTSTVFEDPFNETLRSFYSTREFVLRSESGAKTESFYEICFRQIPEEICNAILDRFEIDRFYCIGLIWENQLFGLVGIFISRGEVLESTQVFESFIRQASIAISQRMTAERLRRSEQRFREVIEIVPVAVSISDPEGRITTLNKAFTDLFGYTPEDIPTVSAWFEKAFPGQAYRKDMMETLNPPQAAARQVHPRICRVRCNNGEVKSVQIQPATLMNGDQYTTYRESEGIVACPVIIKSGL
jgi:PAS domain S-box-containing protein